MAVRYSVHVRNAATEAMEMGEPALMGYAGTRADDASEAGTVLEAMPVPEDWWQDTTDDKATTA